MEMIIDGVEFVNLPAEKYWSFPKSYKGDRHKETKALIMSGNFLGARKEDGHYCRLIKGMNGDIRMQGRSKSVNGDYLDKHEWVPQLQSFFDWLPNGTCLLGELYFPKQRGSRKVTTILGCLKDKAIERQNAGEKLCYYIFDVWALNGETYLNKTMEKRVKALNFLCENWLNVEKSSEDPAPACIKFAEYLKGEKLWEELRKILDAGGEGIVITRQDSKPEPGKRTARKTLKVKMEIEQTIDAFLDGNYKRPTRLYTGKEIMIWPYWENLKTGEKSDKNMYKEYDAGLPWEPVTKPYYNGWASAVSFSVYRDNKPVHIGWISGITDDLKKEIISNPEKWKNKVAELTAMEIEHIDGNFSLRHGKIVKWREDKNATDCTFDQIN